MKSYSTKPTTFFQLKGYPGLKNMAKYIAAYFPNNITNYAEPFAGLARTAEYVKCNTMYLNDLSQYSNEYCKTKFPNAVISNMDFKDFMDQFKERDDIFMLIDPVWRKNIYKNNQLPACTCTPIEYYDTLLTMLDNVKYHWILCVDKDEHEIGKRVSKSKYINLVLEHPTVKMFGKPTGVRLASNKEFIKNESM